MAASVPEMVGIDTNTPSRTLRKTTVLTLLDPWSRCCANWRWTSLPSWPARKEWTRRVVSTEPACPCQHPGMLRHRCRLPHAPSVTQHHVFASSWERMPVRDRSAVSAVAAAVTRAVLDLAGVHRKAHAGAAAAVAAELMPSAAEADEPVAHPDTARMVHTASRNSLIRRVTLANACHRGLEGMRKFFPVPAGLQRSGRKEHAINKNDYSQARRDKHMMGSTGRLEEFRIGRQRKQPAVVQKAVKFILHPENIEMLAWGVRVGGKNGVGWGGVVGWGGGKIENEKWPVWASRATFSGNDRIFLDPRVRPERFR